MKILWDNPSQAQRMGLAAQQRYEQLFTSERMTQAYATLYRDVLQECEDS